MWTVLGAFGMVGKDDVAAGSPLRAAIESLLRTDDQDLAHSVFAQLRSAVAMSFEAEARSLLRRAHYPGSFVEIMLRAGLPIAPEEWQMALQDPSPPNRVTTLHNLPVPLPAELRGRVEQMLRDDAVTVRAAACSALARTLAADAVPALLAALPDQDDAVRKAATEALERIRFQSEQQAYWQDAKAGIQTSPQSAAAKLLRQAQPQEPKEQRLLAIPSLGVLGAAESLPYLIDWTKDADADVAAAARAAVAQIHGKAGAPK
jgi:HEAT repeat protein